MPPKTSSSSSGVATAKVYVHPETDTLLPQYVRENLVNPKQITSSSTGERYVGEVENVTVATSSSSASASAEKNTESGLTARRSGKGALVWPNGNCYMGQWRAGMMHGEGTFLYAVEGDKYIGYFIEDKKHGRGIYTFANGNFFEGDFSNDRRHGKGVYSWTCGDSYDGEWFEGHMQGEGTTRYANGNIYRGHFVHDRREGFGKLTCADGLSYEGDWVKNMRHGHGTLLFRNGDSYIGQWVNDKKHGIGKDTFAESGNVYEGAYADNFKEGYGVIRYGAKGKQAKTKDANEDDLSNINNRNTNGVIIGGGDAYAGEWLRDEMHGIGSYIFRTTQYCYVGQWARNLREGKGIYFYPPPIARSQQLSVAGSENAREGTSIEDLLLLRAEGTQPNAEQRDEGGGSTSSSHTRAPQDINIPLRLRSPEAITLSLAIALTSSSSSLCDPSSNEALIPQSLTLGGNQNEKETEEGRVSLFSALRGCAPARSFYIGGWRGDKKEGKGLLCVVPEDYHCERENKNTTKRGDSEVSQSLDLTNAPFLVYEGTWVNGKMCGHFTVSSTNMNNIINTNSASTSKNKKLLKLLFEGEWHDGILVKGTYNFHTLDGDENTATKKSVVVNLSGYFEKNESVSKAASATSSSSTTYLALGSDQLVPPIPFGLVEVTAAATDELDEKQQQQQQKGVVEKGDGKEPRSHRPMLLLEQILKPFTQDQSHFLFNSNILNKKLSDKDLASVFIKLSKKQPDVAVESTKVLVGGARVNLTDEDTNNSSAATGSSNQERLTKRIPVGVSVSDVHVFESDYDPIAERVTTLRDIELLEKELVLQQQETAGASASDDQKGAIVGARRKDSVVRGKSIFSASSLELIAEMETLAKLRLGKEGGEEGRGNSIKNKNDEKRNTEGRTEGDREASTKVFSVAPAPPRRGSAAAGTSSTIKRASSVLTTKSAARRQSSLVSSSTNPAEPRTRGGAGGNGATSSISSNSKPTPSPPPPTAPSKSSKSVSSASSVNVEQTVFKRQQATKELAPPSSKTDGAAKGQVTTKNGGDNKNGDGGGGVGVDIPKRRASLTHRASIMSSGKGERRSSSASAKTQQQRELPTPNISKMNRAARAILLGNAPQQQHREQGKSDDQEVADVLDYFLSPSLNGISSGENNDFSSLESFCKFILKFERDSLLTEIKQRERLDALMKDPLVHKWIERRQEGSDFNPTEGKKDNNNNTKDNEVDLEVSTLEKEAKISQQQVVATEETLEREKLANAQSNQLCGILKKVADVHEEWKRKNESLAAETQKLENDLKSLEAKLATAESKRDAAKEKTSALTKACLSLTQEDSRRSKNEKEEANESKVEGGEESSASESLLNTKEIIRRLKAKIADEQRTIDENKKKIATLSTNAAKKRREEQLAKANAKKKHAELMETVFELEKDLKKYTAIVDAHATKTSEFNAKQATYEKEAEELELFVKQLTDKKNDISSHISTLEKEMQSKEDERNQEREQQERLEHKQALKMKLVKEKEEIRRRTKAAEQTFLDGQKQRDAELLDAQGKLATAEAALKKAKQKLQMEGGEELLPRGEDRGNKMVASTALEDSTGRVVESTEAVDSRNVTFAAGGRLRRKVSSFSSALSSSSRATSSSSLPPGGDDTIATTATTNKNNSNIITTNNHGKGISTAPSPPFSALVPTLDNLTKLSESEINQRFTVLNTEIEGLKREVEEHESRQEVLKAKEQAATEKREAEKRAHGAQYEVLFNQLSKIRKQNQKLQKEKDLLAERKQQLLKEEAEDAIADQKDEEDKVLKIILSIRQDEWKLTYLRNQLEQRANTIAELQKEVAMIPILEEKIRALQGELKE